MVVGRHPDAAYDHVGLKLTRFTNRLCPGREFADAKLFLAIANIIATLDIGRAKDAEGKEIVPTASFASTSIVRSVCG